MIVGRISEKFFTSRSIDSANATVTPFAYMR